MRLVFFIAILFFSLSSYAETQSREIRFFIEEQSTTFSEPVPIKLFEEDLYGGDFPDNGNNAVTFNSVAMGMSFNGLRFAYFVREDYAFNFTSDTFNLIYMDKNNIKIPDGQNFDIYLNALHLQTAGVQVAYPVFNNQFLQLSVGANVFQADELLEGDISGILTAQGDDVQGNLALDYSHQEDYVLGRDVQTIAEGQGYSFDVDAQFTLTEKLHWTIHLYDVFGEINWDGAPQTVADVSTDTVYVDDQGRLHRAPVMSGHSKYNSLTQDLPVHRQSSLRYRLHPKMSFFYVAEQYQKVVFNRLIMDFRVFRGLQFKTGYDFTTESIWLGAESKYFSFDFATDDFDVDKSKALVLNIQAGYRF